MTKVLHELWLIMEERGCNHPHSRDREQTGRVPRYGQPAAPMKPRREKPGSPSQESHTPAQTTAEEEPPRPWSKGAKAPLGTRCPA